MRPCLAVVVVLAGCASAPPLLPLPLKDPFAVAYDGRVSRGVPTRFRDVTSDDSSGQPTSGPFTIRATVLEMTTDDGRQLLSNLVQVGDVPIAAAVGVQPATNLSLSGLGGAHTSAEAMRAVMSSLRGRADVRLAPEIPLSPGASSSGSTLDRTSYVESISLKPIPGAVLADPQVDAFESGTTLHFTLRDTNGNLSLAVQWQSSEPVLPVPEITTRIGKLQAPFVVSHQLACESPVTDNDALVVGSLPGATKERVQILFLQVDRARTLAQR